jgi:hypothetical protein
MSYELSNWSAPCSRRCLLLGAVAAVTTAVVVGADPTSAIAVIKISEAAVAYQDHPNGEKQCSKCLQFQPPHSCKMVDGTISPQGYCRIFSPIHQADARSRHAPSAG